MAGPYVGQIRQDLPRPNDNRNREQWQPNPKRLIRSSWLRGSYQFPLSSTMVNRRHYRNERKEFWLQLQRQQQEQQQEQQKQEQEQQQQSHLESQFQSRNSVHLDQNQSSTTSHQSDSNSSSSSTFKPPPVDKHEQVQQVSHGEQDSSGRLEQVLPGSKDDVPDLKPRTSKEQVAIKIIRDFHDALSGDQKGEEFKYLDPEKEARKKFSLIQFQGVDRPGLLCDLGQMFTNQGIRMIRVELRRQVEGPLGREEYTEMTKGEFLVQRKDTKGFLEEDQVEELIEEMKMVWKEGLKNDEGDGMVKREKIELLKEWDDIEMKEMEDKMLWQAKDSTLRVDTIHATQYMSLFMTSKHREGLLQEIFNIVTGMGLDVRMAAFTTWENENRYRQDTMFFVSEEGGMPSEFHRVTLFYKLYDLVVRFDD